MQNSSWRNSKKTRESKKELIHFLLISTPYPRSETSRRKDNPEIFLYWLELVRIIDAIETKLENKTLATYFEEEGVSQKLEEHLINRIEKMLSPDYEAPYYAKDGKLTIANVQLDLLALYAYYSLKFDPPPLPLEVRIDRSMFILLKEVPPLLQHASNKHRHFSRTGSSTQTKKVRKAQRQKEVRELHDQMDLKGLSRRKRAERIKKEREKRTQDVLDVKTYERDLEELGLV